MWMGLGKKITKSYDSTKKFQAKWATKLPWAKVLGLRYFLV
jgi:hypothetical protein